MHRLGAGHVRCFRFAALGLLALVGACAVSDRAESLFLRQHRAALALAETIALKEEQDPALAQTLYAAEGDLDAACAPLRRAGILRLQGEDMDGALEWAIIGALDDCTRTTEWTESLLWRVSPDTAAFSLPPPAPATRQALQENRPLP